MLTMSFQGISQDTVTGNFCISQQEVHLFNLINDYRKTMNLPSIPLSKSLCVVADKHIYDLAVNKPDTGYCNFHSWSNKGNWSTCCFRKAIRDRSCMTSKPKEITNYPGIGFEIIYWENRNISPESALDQWRETPASRAMITCTKEWESFSWNAMGVAVDNGFAIVWLGEEIDGEKETMVCGSNAIIQYKPVVSSDSSLVVSYATKRYYLIFGHFSNLKEAKDQVKKYQKEGFSKCKIVAKDNKYRISLSDHSTQELASKAKKELPEKYKTAWILPF
jgi:hypothetical protein